jgi:hypothetical protein
MPELVNPFNSDDAFNMASLCAAINILPNMYGRVQQLGLFTPDPITTRTAIVEEQNGILNLIKTQPVGSQGNYNKVGKRSVRSFVVPHIPLPDIIMPSEFSGIRAFGQTSAMETLASVMQKHLQTAKNKFAITLEYLRMGALKGIIYDADASTLYNLYTEFEITQKTVDFALDTDTTDVAGKCRDVLRHIEENLKGEVMNGVRALVDSTFFDALIKHPEVEKYYEGHAAFLQLQGSGADPRKGFTFSGITFEEYRGTATDEDGTARPFITAGYGHAFPTGTMNTFKTVYAPAEFLETVNTPGLELYAKQATEKFGRWVDLWMESNPLPLCCRPAVLVTLTA